MKGKNEGKNEKKKIDQVSEHEKKKKRGGGGGG